MRRTAILFFVAMMAATAMAQITLEKATEVRIWVGNYMTYSKNIDNVDSITFVEVTPPTAVQINDGELMAGAFHLSANRIIHFSRGNLQYHPKNKQWRFAENQFDCLLEDNKNVSADYDGWIDLFGWGTGDNPTLVSANDSDFVKFVDWGTNAISNGGNVPNKWRTLTKDEWMYIARFRPNADSLKSMATVNGVLGCIFLPDDWDNVTEIKFVPNLNNCGTNVYTLAQWKRLEALGAIFLPVVGSRGLYEGQITFGSRFGYYWSSSADEYTPNYGKGIGVQYDFGSYFVTELSSPLKTGCGVRLIIDVE